MRWLLSVLVTGLVPVAQGVTVEMRHTHGVFYPDVKQQAILQLKITGEPGEKITKLEFSGGKTTQTTDIQMARLATSGGWNGYTLNTNRLVQERGRAKAKSLLLAGFAHMDEPMTTAVANPETRRSMARNMATWAIERGYNGIDIDWEYPDTHEQWVNFGLFIADLREEIAGSGLSISMAASVTYKVPIFDVTDQLDFIMTMSYDDIGPQHASMQRFQGDANRCRDNFCMPNPRIVVGLPFYSNEQGKLTEQFGYSQIISWYPSLKPGDNTFQSKKQDGSPGPMHSFNGSQLIVEKCKWMKQQKFGGVMIWAYDTDVKMSHHASLAKAMYKVVRQPGSSKK